MDRLVSDGSVSLYCIRDAFHQTWIQTQRVISGRSCVDIMQKYISEYI
jgi:hypothetical protein